MGTIDGFLAKAKDFAKAAGSKTEEVVEQTKLRLQISTLKSNIDANYQKLGEIAYGERKTGQANENLTTMCVAELDAQLEELAELNAKLEQMKNEARYTSYQSQQKPEASYVVVDEQPSDTEQPVETQSDENKQDIE